MAQPVSIRLSRNSQPYWLTHVAKPQGSPLRPLLLFPGGDGQGVEVEDSLILAASPLLQRTTSNHGGCSSIAIVLPFVGSSTLRNFVALLRQGRVTIAKEELSNLEAIFSVLEIKVATSIRAVCESSIFTKGDCELLKTKDVKEVEGARSNQKGNQPGCITPSVSHICKTPSLLHTMLSSPTKRPTSTPLKEEHFTPKEEPTGKSKGDRTCTGQVDSIKATIYKPSSAPPRQPQPQDPSTMSSSTASEQMPPSVPEAPKSPIEAEKQQVLSAKESSAKGIQMEAQGEVAPQRADLECSATSPTGQASSEGTVSNPPTNISTLKCFRSGQQQSSCASTPRSVQGTLFATPQGKFLQLGSRRILLSPDVTVKNGKVEVTPAQMAALTGNRPLLPKTPQAKVTSQDTNNTNSLPDDKGATPNSTAKETMGAQRKEKARLAMWEIKCVTNAGRTSAVKTSTCKQARSSIINSPVQCT